MISFAIDFKAQSFAIDLKPRKINKQMNKQKMKSTEQFTLHIMEHSRTLFYSVKNVKRYKYSVYRIKSTQALISHNENKNTYVINIVSIPSLNILGVFVTLYITELNQLLRLISLGLIICLINLL